MLSKRRATKSLLYYKSLIAKNKTGQIPEERVLDEVISSRNFIHKEILDNNKRRREQVTKTRTDVSKAIEMRKADDEDKNEHIITNNTLTSLISGVTDSKDKRDYIKNNEEGFKGLKPNEQRELFKLYITFL